MSEQFVKVEDVKWEPTKILHRPDGSYEFDILLPDFLASWDVFAVWERDRFLSMKERLRPEHVLFDIGAENGWMTAIYGKYFVNPANVCIFEPTPEFWPNIRHTWIRNGLALFPRAAFCGLVSNETKNEPKIIHELDDKLWPMEAGEPWLTRARSYRYIHEHGHNTPQVSLDDFWLLTGIAPDALTIDVEGGEGLVLRGAAAVLLNCKPLVWCSIHPDLMAANYEAAGELFAFMDSMGYRATKLAEDHEQHFLFEPEKIL